SIDTVVCTHLHVDHVGWNTMRVNDRWVPTFPKARYLMGRTELAYWQSRQEEDDHHRSFVDSVRPVLDAGLVDLVDADHRVCEELRLVSTPGHTPGHVSGPIASRGGGAPIRGSFPHPRWQMASLARRSTADHDPARAARTRREVFDMLAGTETLLFGTHFATPSAGRVVRDGGAFALVVWTRADARTPVRARSAAGNAAPRGGRAALPGDVALHGSVGR